MVLLYILTLGMISLPTGLARHFVVETAGSQRENDYIEVIDERKEIDKFVNEINKKGNDYGLGNLFVKKQGKWQMMNFIYSEMLPIIVSNYNKYDIRCNAISK